MKYFTIKYEEDSFGEGELFPKHFSTKTEFTFDGDASWDSILYQFCKHLEAIGYVGVVEQVYVANFINNGHFKHPREYKPKGSFEGAFATYKGDDTEEKDEDTSS